MNDEYFKRIKEHIKNMAPLRLRSLTKDDISERNPKDFLAAFFTKYNLEYDTMYVSGNLQTERKKRRSIEDIYRIVLYYFPNASITKLYKNLIDLVRQGTVSSAICQVLGKRVYRKTTNSESSFFNSEPIDEFKVDFTELDLEGISINSENRGWGHEYTSEDIKFIL